MSALSVKRTLESRAGIAQDSAGYSGADLTQTAMRNESSMPSQRSGLDGGRLSQMGYRGVKDTFTRPNGAVGGTYSSDGRKPWEVDNTGWTISTNTLVHDGVATRYAVIDSGLSDFIGIRFKLSALTGNSPRVVLRSADTTAACVALRRDQAGDNWNLEYDTGPVSLGTLADTVDLVANDVIELQLRSSVLTIIVNDVVRGTITSTAIPTYVSAGTKQGFKGIAANGYTVDDFYVWSLV